MKPIITAALGALAGVLGYSLFVRGGQEKPSPGVPALRPMPIEAKQATSFNVSYEPAVLRYVMAPAPGSPIPVTVTATPIAGIASPVFQWEGRLVWESPDHSYGVVSSRDTRERYPSPGDEELRGLLIARRAAQR